MHGAVPSLPIRVHGVYRQNFTSTQLVVWEELTTYIVLQMLQSVDRS